MQCKSISPVSSCSEQFLWFHFIIFKPRKFALVRQRLETNLYGQEKSNCTNNWLATQHKATTTAINHSTSPISVSFLRPQNFRPAPKELATDLTVPLGLHSSSAWAFNSISESRINVGSWSCFAFSGLNCYVNYCISTNF